MNTITKYNIIKYSKNKKIQQQVVETGLFFEQAKKKLEEYRTKDFLYEYSMQLQEPK